MPAQSRDIHVYTLSMHTGSETHFKVVVVSEYFNDVPLIKVSIYRGVDHLVRHIYNYMKAHAGIHVYTPGSKKIFSDCFGHSRDTGW